MHHIGVDDASRCGVLLRRHAEEAEHDLDHGSDSDRRRYHDPLMGDSRILARIRFFGRLHRQSRLRIHERIGRGSERLFGHGIRIVPDDVRSADRGHHPGGLCGAREVRCHRMVPVVLGPPGVCPDGTLGMERGLREHRTDRTGFRRRRRGPHLCGSERSRIGDVRRQQEGQHPPVAGAQRTSDIPGGDDAVGRMVRFQRRFRNIR